MLKNVHLNNRPILMDSNQEIIEQIKNNIAAMEEERKKDTDAADKSLGVLKYLKERICEMIFKVQEVDENNIDMRERKLHITVAELPNFLAHVAQDEDLIEVNSTSHSSSWAIAII